MSLRDTAAADFRAILDKDNETVEFQNLATSATFTAKCQLVRTTDRYDPQTRMNFNEEVSGLVLPLESIADGETMKDRTHIATFTDVRGTSLTMRCVSPAYNYSLGFVRFNLESYKTV